jgi:hypothetical protein
MNMYGRDSRTWRWYHCRSIVGRQQGNSEIVDTSRDTQNKSAFRFLRSRWLWGSALLAAILVLVLVAIPMGIAYSLKSWLRDNGGEQVQLADIDFNPFAGVAIVEHLQVSVGDSSTLAIPHLLLDIDWSPLFSRQVYIKTVTLDGVHLEVEQGPDGILKIGGITLPPDDAEETAGVPWDFGISHLRIENSSIVFRTAALQLESELHELVLSELSTWAHEPAQLQLNGSLNGAQVKLEGTLPPLAEGFGYAGTFLVSGTPLDRFAKTVQPALSALSGSLAIDGRVDAALRPDGMLAAGLEGLVRLDQLHLEQEGMQLDHDQLQWNGSVQLAMPDKDGELGLSASGTLTGRGLVLGMPDAAIDLQQERLEWQGELRLNNTNAKLQAEVTGKLLSTGLAMQNPQDGPDLQQAGLAWDGAITLISAAQNLDMTARGTLGSSSFAMQLPRQGVEMEQAGLAWDGEIELLAAAENLDVTARGTLSSDSIAVQMPQEGVDLKQGALAWEGDVGYATGGTGDLQISGNLKLENLLLDSARGNIHLARLDEVKFDNIDVKGPEDFALDRLTVNGAVFAQGMAAGDATQPQDAASPPLHAASLHVNQLKFSANNRLTIDSIESRDTRYSAVREPGGKWRITLIMDALPFTGADKTPATAAEEPPDAETPGSIRIGSINITGDSSLTLDDRDVSPPFGMRLNLKQAVIRDIDTARPDQDSRITLKANIARHDRVEIQGTVRPFASPLKLDLQGLVEGLELPPLSPFTIASIGHRLDSGQLDADTSLRIDNGQLDGSNRLTMRGLKITPVRGDELQKMQSQLAVPLDSALDMLRDKHNTIRLELPISGDLDNPDFDISDAINQAVAKATKKGAMTYLTLALQPYGTLITIAQMAGDMASKVRLDPVVFTPASTAIDYARFEYLDKVAGILKERPEVNIKLCGVAVESDRDAFEEQAAASAGGDGKEKQAETAPEPPRIGDDRLLALADQRDAAVKEYLISKHAVPAARLVACQPQIDADAAAEPRVDLLI